MASDHDASASALGYVYQLKWALLALASSALSKPDQSLTLESLDDVGWTHADGTVEELVQLKHHKPGNTGDLSDMSPDVWRTLKVWMDDPRFMEPDGPLLTIVSTSTASQGSAASFLRSNDRDEDSALRLLDTAASKSTAKATKDSRERWNALGPAAKQGLIQRVRVCDGSAPIFDIDDSLRMVLGVAPPIGHETTYLDLIWAWWFRVCLDLLDGRRRAVDGLDFHRIASGIRDRMTPENLVTTVDATRFDRNELMAVHGGRLFVTQLSWLQLRERQVEKAVLDYHRAITQTTEWIDGKLLEMRELETFKEALIDEWENSFDDMMNRLPADASEDQRRSAGRQLYELLRDSSAVQVRAQYSDAFYARGARCEIADGGTHGWHPEFDALIRSITIEAE